MAISHLFHKNYRKHKGVVTQLKSLLNPDKTSKPILCGGNKRTVSSLKIVEKHRNSFKKSYKSSTTLPFSIPLLQSPKTLSLLIVNLYANPSSLYAIGNRLLPFQQWPSRPCNSITSWKQPRSPCLSLGPEVRFALSPAEREIFSTGSNTDYLCNVTMNQPNELDTKKKRQEKQEELEGLRM